ncbi:MAG TPA: hypothetical protein VGR02_09310 [Thermoanaerobaculia bacterium]|jgi:hypothetical protein|nr:hypothetical protein [Thermoanaerobaculia bacterium]
MVRRCLLAALVLAASLARGQEQPLGVSVLPGGTIGVALPLSILQRSDVRKQLGGGLTTTFLITARDGDTKGGARIEVRYDLWDEVYYVRRIEFDARQERQRFTAEQLERWWRTTPVRLLATTQDALRLQVELSVLPFSAAEEEDARQWLSKSGGVGSASHGARSPGLVDVLIGTTIQARPLLTFKWAVEVRLR